MTDSRFESCILLIRQGDKTGLREIYDGYYKSIYSVMLSTVKNTADAEDLTADFFLKLWEKLADTYEGENGHKRWLVTAAKNMAVDFIRKNSRIQLTVDSSPEEENVPHTEPVNESFENDLIGSLTVREALTKLNDGEREIITLKLFADLTFKEIARALSKPLGTVTWKYRSAIQKLRNYIKEVQNNE